MRIFGYLDKYDGVCGKDYKNIPVPNPFRTDVFKLVMSMENKT